MNLSLEELLKNMSRLKKKYEIKSIMLHKNRLVLKAIKPKDLNVSGGRRINDALTDMLIQEEENLFKLDDIKEAYNLYREMAINILVEYAMVKSKKEMIKIYRDTMHFKWEDIAWLVGYSRSQTIEIYNKYKNRTLPDV